MEKIINRLIDDAVVDVDKYVNNNSTWLIFTESKVQIHLYLKSEFSTDH